MFKKISFTILCTIICLISCINVCAHPGRLDRNGGHRKTSDGTYHYHVGSDRTVEYNTKPGGGSSSYSESSSTSANQIKEVQKPTPKIYATDLKMFIRGKEIKTYSYVGDSSFYVFVAEDLENYGYDINWVSEWNTVYISRNPAKEVVGMSLPATYNGQFISDVYDSNIVVRLTFANGESYAPPAYSLNGRMVIPVDEAKCLGAFRYDGESHTVYID